MIICFSGVPGAGKSYDTVKKILDNLRLGRTIYTNVDGLDDPVCREHIKLYTGLDDYQLNTQLIFLTPDKIVRFWESEKVNAGTEFESERLICEKGSLIVIDEVHKWFNCRDWQTEKNRKFADWASTHRHSGYDVLLVTQDLEKVDKQIRSLVEWTYVYRKINFLGSFVKNSYICYAYSGDDTSGKPLANAKRFYDKRVFACYQSHTTKDIKELSIMTHANILRHPVFYSIPVMVVVFIYFFSKSSLATGDLFGAQKFVTDQQKRQQKQQAPQLPFAAATEALKTGNPIASPSPSPVAVPSVSAPLPPLPVASVPTPVSTPYTRYKIEGYVDAGGGLIVAYVNGVKVKLPSPAVKSFNLQTMTVVAKTDEFGSPETTGNAPSRPSPGGALPGSDGL